MEYTIIHSEWNEHKSKEFTEKFEGTPQEIAELLRLTNGMGEDRCGGNCKCSDSGGQLKPLEISDFKDKNIVVNCRTRELAEEFSSKLKDKGYDTNCLDWSYYGEETCFELNNNNMFYSPCDYYKREGYEVIEFTGW